MGNNREQAASLAARPQSTRECGCARQLEGHDFPKNWKGDAGVRGFSQVVRLFSSFVLLIGALPCFTGCATAPTNSGGVASQTQAKLEKTRANLHKGMTTDEVRTAWGEPQKIAPMPDADGHADVWTYWFVFHGPVRQVQTGEKTYIRYNPNTRVDETMREPVYSIEQTETDETVELLFYDGRLTEWKQSSESKRRYN